MFINNHNTAAFNKLRAYLLLPIITFVLACTDQAPRGGGDVLVIGDSVMAWNRSANASIPDVMGQVLNRTVTSKAVPGAQFDNASGIAGAVGFDIQQQLPAGRWNWIVMNGGANDLGADCGCGACGPVVDALIGLDANSGAIPKFIRKAKASTGANIIWMGYYAGSGMGSFAGCRDDLVQMEARIARFAASQRGIYFVDSEDAINRKDRTLFASDNTHPSAKGSALIGIYLSDQIKLHQTQNTTGG